MKILAIIPCTSFLVETDDGDYRRSPFGDWEKRYGESWEAIHPYGLHNRVEVEQLEKQFLLMQANTVQS